MTNPIDTLVARYQEFRAQGGEILTMRREVAAMLYELKHRATPPEDAIATLNAQEAALDTLYRDWNDANDRAQAVIGTLRSLHIPLPTGLGVAPVLAAGVVVAIGGAVTAMVLVGGKVLAQRQLLNAIKSKLLTPSEAAAVGKAAGTGIGGFFGGMGLTGLAVLAVVAFMFLRGQR